MIFLSLMIVFIISIHAPVKGATAPVSKDDGRHSISIHAPVKGATYTDQIAKEDPYNFNPRSREGSDYWKHIA